jgi:hypothetical protein
LSSTSVKLVGGLSGKDAGIFAKEMNCEPEFLQNMRKAKGYTQFACYVRNHTRRPIALTVPLRQMEKQEKLTSAQLEQVLAENRRRYGATATGHVSGCQRVRRCFGRICCRLGIQFIQALSLPAANCCQVGLI